MKSSPLRGVSAFTSVSLGLFAFALEPGNRFEKGIVSCDFFFLKTLLLQIISNLGACQNSRFLEAAGAIPHSCPVRGPSPAEPRASVGLVAGVGGRRAPTAPAHTQVWAVFPGC